MKYTYQPDVLLNWADSGQAPVHLATMEVVKANPEKYPVAAVNYTILMMHDTSGNIQHS